MGEITEDYIWEAEYDEISTYADTLGVPLDGLDELKDMKERLVMQLRKNAYGNPKTLIAKALDASRQEDIHKRSKITMLLEEFQKTIEENDTTKDTKKGLGAIKDLLRTEGTVRNLHSELKNHIQRMKNGECVCVVAGETSAGKSSLLNLLLGVNILPVHNNSATFVITRISFGKKMRAAIHYQEAGVTPEKFEDIDMEWVHQHLWPRLYVKDEKQRQTQSHIKEIRFEIPSEILRCGLVIVDSPGIGENEAMDNVIADFIQENDIMGYIYVIKSDNGGGVDEDRLLNMLRMVIEKQKVNKEAVGQFDSKSAIFVCNRWDLVKAEEQCNVMEICVKRLKDCWPNLSSSQVIPFKTEYALNEAKYDPDFIPEMYHVFLEHLRDMHIHAMDHRIQETYRWLEKVLKRSIFQLNTVVGQVNMSETDMKDKIQEVTEKLHKLQNKSGEVVDELRFEAEETSKEICEIFRQELRKPYAKVFLTKWLPEELPERDMGNWLAIKMSLHWRIAERVIKLIENWESEQGHIAAVEERVSNSIQCQLSLLQNEMTKIEEGMSSRTELTAREQLRRSISNPLTLRRMSSRISVSEAPNNRILPIKLISRVLNPVQNVLENIKSTKLVDKLVLARKEKAYKENQAKVAKERAEKFLRRLLEPRDKEDDILQMMISNLMERSLSQLSELEKNIPALVKANDQLLQQVLSCRENALYNREVYQSLKKTLEGTERRLMHYYKGYISVKNMRDIEVLSAQNDQRNSKSFRVSNILHTSFYRSSAEKKKTIVPGGLWTVIQRGKYNGCDITMKMYLPSSFVDTTYSEVAKLRFLRDSSMASLEGIHYSDAPPPVFVFQDSLYTLTEKLPRWPRDSKANKFTIIQQTIEGLSYLNKHRLVHMELSLDTVTVNHDGEVKLTAGCLPRRFERPPSEIEQSGNFVYLAPDVLRGAMYSSSSDVYSLGLFVFELLTGVKPFSHFRELMLHEFVKTVNPFEMFDSCGDLKSLSSDTAEFIRTCIAPKHDPDSFLSKEEVEAAIKYIRNENVEIKRESISTITVYQRTERRQ